MPRMKTVKAFGEWVKDEVNVQRVLDLTAEGKPLHKIAVAVKQPYTCLYPFLNDGGEMQKRYEAARAARSESLVDESLEIADSVRGAENAAAVGAAKLAVETRHNIAAFWNPGRYGKNAAPERAVDPAAGVALLGAAADLLKIALDNREAKVLPVVIEHEER